MADTQTARDILPAVVTRYAGFRSYQDRGVVRIQFAGDDPLLELTFETTYSAPNLFRFEFVSPHPYPPLRHITTHHIVGSDGITAYALIKVHNAVPELRIEPNLELAIAGATGISSGSAHTIARLLLPEVQGFGVGDLEKITLVGETELEGRVCYRITGNHPRGGRYEICIEKDTLLLRSLSSKTAKLPSDEIRKDIRIDEPLDPRRFDVPTREA